MYIIAVPFDGAEVAHKVTSILLTYNAKLEGFLKQKHLEKFASSLHSADIITDDLRDNPVYSEILQDFISYAECLDEKQELEEHCKVFLNALRAVGGPMKRVADQIRHEWKTNCELHIDFD